ncbi:hypothetical protein [Streptomyces lavendofoliae]|uniref:DUF8129 domain-containing protein n=1 Tax=Streptomyces lavendofoliae TaxID=67314 RepID=A0A918I100_9ACTN|nr:hypothetical protein [Streptomyces lavendofoliae]GGU46363.1 hypothetical protein GCM10010274_38380 [Streptomyces lavendofoliae]
MTTDHGGLPLPDYDRLSVGTLEHRIRTLSVPELDRLLHYEHQHADRAMVVQVLTARKRQLDAGAPLSSGNPAAFKPGTAGQGRGGSPVSPATASPEPANPPTHGAPDQRGEPKGDRTG